MKAFLKAVAAAAVLVAGTAPAIANVNIGGLSVPTGGHFEVASIYENTITGAGQTLRGVGEVTQINGQAVSTLCAGCELTYVFDNYLVTSLTATQVNFSGGTIRFYLDFGGLNFNPFSTANSAADLAAASDGVLFMTLKGHAVNAAGDTFIGQGTNIGLANAVGNGSGLGDIVLGGGIASANFDTNSIVSAFGGFADFQIGSSFSNVLQPHPSECTGLAPTGPECLAGSADIRGLVRETVPEPTSMALVGLALVGLGIASKVKAKRSA